MNLTLKEIEELIITAKGTGVDELSMEGLRIKFKPKYKGNINPFPIQTPDNVQSSSLRSSSVSDFINRIPPKAAASVPDVKAEDLIKPLSPLDDLTPEEILYYAVPHYDQIQADKEAHKKKLEDEKINGG